MHSIKVLVFINAFNQGACFHQCIQSRCLFSSMHSIKVLDFINAFDQGACFHQCIQSRCLFSSMHLIKVLVFVNAFNQGARFYQCIRSRCLFSSMHSIKVLVFINAFNQGARFYQCIPMLLRFIRHAIFTSYLHLLWGGVGREFIGEGYYMRSVKVLHERVLYRVSTNECNAFEWE